jgi:hypoxanthine phosphoribosyltransferase
MDDRNLKLLYTEAEIEARVSELAATISRDYRDTGEIVLIGVLKGAFIFLADLCRRLTVPHRVDFVALSSYGDATVSGAVRLVLDLRDPITDRHVLVVDDILDTGKTLRYLMETLEAQRPASLKSCVLTRKRKDRPAAIRADYVGLEIPDVWVVGYGLDLADHHRTLPHIAEIDPASV